MSTFTTLRDKLEHMLSAIFGAFEPIGEEVVTTTGEAIATAAIAGTVHGSDDMIAVAKASLNSQLPTLKNEALTAAASLITHDAATKAATPTT